MNNKIIFSALCIMVALSLNAQSDYSSYLDKAMEKLSTGDCESAQKFYNVYKDLSGDSKPSVQVLIDDCKKVAENKATTSKKTTHSLDNNSYCNANKNRFIAWNIAGAGYPWNLVSGIEFRGGNLIGYGLYGDIGMDFTSISVKDGSYLEYAHTTKTSFRYAAGIKFYPYNGLFVDFGYGTIAPASAKVTYFYGGTLDSDEKIEVRDKISASSHGLLFHAGYNYVTDLSDGAGFFLGISGGASYDVINKVVAPSFNLKIGVAWGWFK